MIFFDQCMITIIQTFIRYMCVSHNHMLVFFEDFELKTIIFSSEFEETSLILKVSLRSQLRFFNLRRYCLKVLNLVPILYKYLFKICYCRVCKCNNPLRGSLNNLESLVVCRFYLPCHYSFWVKLENVKILKTL